MGEPPKVSRAQLAAVVAGNALEFYDFLIFGFFAVQIGAVFFPVKDCNRQPAFDPGEHSGWAFSPGRWAGR